MNDILAHHGILGQKWGVRRYQNKDGSLTKAGKDRYGVGKSNSDRIIVDKRDEFKNKYNEVLDSLRSAYKHIASKAEGGKINFEDFKEISLRLVTIEGYALNDDKIDREFRDFAKTAGLKIPDGETTVSFIAELKQNIEGLYFEKDGSSFDPIKFEKLMDTALECIAVDDASKLMNNSIGATDADVQIQEDLEKAYDELDKAGLSGLFNVITYSLNGKQYIFYEYVYPDSEVDVNGNNLHSEIFMANDIENMKKFALKNDLFFKDYRTSQNSRSRKKNVDLSAEPKTITKREKLEVSDKERKDKDVNSRKNTENRSTQLSNILKGKKRTEAAIKQTEAIKKQQVRDAEKKEKERTERLFKINESIGKKIVDSFQSTVLPNTIKKINFVEGFSNAYLKYWKEFQEKMYPKKRKFEHSDTTRILIHHGILNQKWGVRNGPPYPLGGGDYSPSEKKAIKWQRRKGNSIYNKKHFDEVLRKDTTILSTLSYDKHRTENTDMFYATHDIWDKHQYNALFNRKVPKTLYDEDGKAIGTGNFLKFRIDNSLKSDIRVASEDSGAKIFKNLYKKDRDFYNFVTDSSRMEDYFVKEKYKFKGYQESGKVLKKIRSPTYSPTENDVQALYRMFNYVIPYDGQGNARKGSDVAKQRAKFFNELKKAGYGAVLDTNDAIYGGFKAKSPVIVFDMEQIIPKEVYQTTMNDKAVSEAALVMRKLLKL